MKSIGKHLSEKYICKGLIEPQFSDAYTYVFDYMFNFILYNVSLIFIGFILNQPLAAVIYIIITGSLRAISGWYHCKTRISCFLLSYTVFTLYLFLTAITPLISTYILLLIYILGWILIIKISPVAPPNKRFTQVIKQTAKKRTYILFIFNSIFTIISLLLHWNKVLFFNDLCLIICVIGLYAGYFSNRRQPHES